MTAETQAKIDRAFEALSLEQQAEETLAEAREALDEARNAEEEAKTAEGEAEALRLQAAREAVAALATELGVPA